MGPGVWESNPQLTNHCCCPPFDKNRACYHFTLCSLLACARLINLVRYLQKKHVSMTWAGFKPAPHRLQHWNLRKSWRCVLSLHHQAVTCCAIDLPRDSQQSTYWAGFQHSPHWLKKVAPRHHNVIVSLRIDSAWCGPKNQTKCYSCMHIAWTEFQPLPHQLHKGNGDAVCYHCPIRLLLVLGLISKTLAKNDYPPCPDPSRIRTCISPIIWYCNQRKFWRGVLLLHHQAFVK